MSRHMLLCFLSCFLCVLSFCQDAELHRLQALPDDTAKVSKLIGYAKTLDRNENTFPELAAAIIRLSERLTYHNGMAAGKSFLAYLNIMKGNNRGALNLYQEALVQIRKARDEFGVAQCLGNLATAYDRMGQTDSAIIYRLEAVSMLEKLKAKIPFGTAHLRSLSLQYFNLGAGYENNLEHASKALSYYLKANNLAKEGKDTSMVVSTLQGVVQGYISQKQIKQASASAKEALSIAKLSGNDGYLAHGYDSYALVLIEMNKFDDAIGAAQQAVKFAERSGDVTQFVFCSLTLSTALNKKEDYKAQINVLEKALTLAKETDNFAYASDLYGPLAEANAMLGNHKKAYLYLTRRYEYKDSVAKLENNKIMADMEFRYQSAQKEKALAAKQLQLAQKNFQLQKSQKVIIYSISIAALAIGLAVFLFLYYKSKRKLHHRELEFLTQEKEIQLLQALMQGEEKERSRIARDLHDGVAGMLSAAKMQLSSLTQQISQHTNEGLFKPVMKLLDDASREVRLTSHNLMPEMLLHYGLEKAIQRYCSNISTTHGLVVQYDSWGEIGRYKEGFELSVYRIVQELLNNAVKHSKATQALVQVSEQNGILSIAVEDNGKGFRDEQKDGIGLQTIRSRVKAMNGILELDGTAGSGVSAYLQFETAGLKRISAAALEQM